MEFGSAAPESVGSLMHTVVDGHMASKMTANQRAAAAWYRANGDRERAHTTGVFLKRPRVAGAAPVLGVYVDSHAMATDFGVNKDLYLARLANIGCEVSGIEFLPTRRPRQAKETAPTPAQPIAEPLPELSTQEQLAVQLLVADLPADLQQAASKAISLSKRRQKLEDAKNGKNA